MRIEKPWGTVKDILKLKKINIRLINIKPKSRLSLQSHKLRDEMWFLLEGNLYCQIGEKVIKMKKCIPYIIRRGTKHRLSAPQEGGRIIEISFGKFEEEDILRYEDDYGRVM